MIRTKGHHAVSRAQVLQTTDEAVAGIEDGSTVLVGGFGLAGHAVRADRRADQAGRQGPDRSCRNNAGNGDVGLAALLAAGQVRKVICSFPRQADSWVFDGLYRAGKIELEVVPQGNLAERMRAAGAGIGAFFCPDRRSARRWPRARRPARSTAGPTCWSTRSRATSR